MAWGMASRPKASNKLGIPNRSEGSDGDIQVRQTNLGAKLFGKIGGRWHSAFLSSEDEIIGTSGTKIGMSSSGALTVDQINLSGKITLTSTGTANICIGVDNSDVGSHNIAIGVGALEKATSVENTNIAIGTYALQNMDGTGSSAGTDSNVVIGKASGVNLDEAASTVAVGTLALASSDSGNAYSLYNVAIGNWAMLDNTGSGYNTCIGGLAGRYITDGGFNTFVGIQSGYDVTTGDANICIGYLTKTGDADSQIAIVIGNNITGAANDFSFGKASNVVSNDFDTDNAWSHSSDERKKRNIQDDTLGLSFINDLKTKTFQWKPAEEHPEEWHAWKDLEDEDGNLTGEKEYHEMNTDSVMHGLIAQEVKSALDKANISTFGGWKERVNGEQSLSTEMFVYPLIKAVQELSAKVDTMQTQINNLTTE